MKAKNNSEDFQRRSRAAKLGMERQAQRAREAEAKRIKDAPLREARNIVKQWVHDTSDIAPWVDVTTGRRMTRKQMSDLEGECRDEGRSYFHLNDIISFGGQPERWAWDPSDDDLEQLSLESGMEDDGDVPF